MRFLLRRNSGAAGHLVREHGPPPSRHFGNRARPTRHPGRGRVRDRRQPGVLLRADEAARRARAIGGPDHRAAAPEGDGRAGALHVHAEPAAHHGERPVRRIGLPAHHAEPQPEGPVRVGAQAYRQNEADPRFRGRQRRPADRRAAGDGGYRPRPRAGAGRDPAADTGRAVQRLRQAPGFGDLRARRPVRGDSGARHRSTSARRMRCRSSTSARPRGRWCRSTR